VSTSLPLLKQQFKVRVGLSGFGVELAIKNTEYKAVDDSAHKDDGNEDGEVHGFDFGVLRYVPQVFLQFMNIMLFSKNLPHLKDSLKQFKSHLSELEELVPLKQWEVSELG
jgi:UDP-glucose:glycoprotein glucosyltransferase